MRKRNKGQRGFAMIYVLCLMAALLVLLGAASSMIYAMHKQSQKDKSELAVRAAKYSNQHP